MKKKNNKQFTPRELRDTMFGEMHEKDLYPLIVIGFLGGKLDELAVLANASYVNVRPEEVLPAVLRILAEKIENGESPTTVMKEVEEQIYGK